MIGRLLRALQARLREPSMGPPSPPVPDAAFLIGIPNAVVIPVRPGTSRPEDLN